MGCGVGVDRVRERERESMLTSPSGAQSFRASLLGSRRLFVVAATL